MNRRALQELLPRLACWISGLTVLCAAGTVFAQPPTQPPIAGKSPAVAGSPAAASPGEQNAVDARWVEGAQVMAWVAGEPILASEVLPRVDTIMEQNRDKIPEHAWDQQRLMLVQEALKGTVELKLVVADALSNIPAVNRPELEKKVDEQFEAEQIKRLMDEKKVSSRAELEAKLAAEHSSIEQQRRIYFERSLAMQWVRQVVQVNKEISHNEMLAYYQANLKDFEHPARVRWQQLSVDVDRFGSRSEAYAALARMGNKVFRNEPWEQVAKSGSHGPTAAEGGMRDWTTKGSMASEVLDHALFALPEGAMSPILEDERTFHIVRIVEREDAHRTPFPDAQAGIREKIEQKRRDEEMEKYYAKLRKETRVWTVFDDPATAERFATSLRSSSQR